MKNNFKKLCAEFELRVLEEQERIEANRQAMLPLIEAAQQTFAAVIVPELKCAESAISSSAARCTVTEQTVQGGVSIWSFRLTPIAAVPVNVTSQAVFRFEPDSSIIYSQEILAPDEKGTSWRSEKRFDVKELSRRDVRELLLGFAAEAFHKALSWNG